MKLKTSWFNKTVFRKDILRYSPIWAVYTIFLLLVIFGLSDSSRLYMARNVGDYLKAMAWINLFYGGICGVFLFMDLFNGRLCNALHAFPMRREGWLTTHIFSGFLFSFVPNLLVSVISALMLLDYAYVAPIWLVGATLQFVFFFGTAVLAAMCAGNLLGTVAIYGITHFITVLVYAVIQLLYQPLLFGVRLNDDGYARFFPLSKMTVFEYAELTYSYESSIGLGDAEAVLCFNGLEGEAWIYVGLCAVVGVLCLLLAGLVYRRRHLETAGDFISLKPLAPIFLLICTVGGGAFLYAFSDLVGDPTYLFLILGMAIGYFAAKMFLERTVKVFGKKSLLGLGVLVAVLGSSLLLTWLDPVGITTYVPKLSSIESACVTGADRGYSYDSLFDYNVSYREDGYKITDAEGITQLQDFHRELISYRPSDDDGVWCDVRIQYKLKSGKVVSRYYEVGRNTDLGKQAGKYFSEMGYVFNVKDEKRLYDAFSSVNVNIYEDGMNIDVKLTSRHDIADLLDAIAKDCQAGKMAQNWAFHQENGIRREYSVEFTVADSDQRQKLGWNNNYFYLQIYADSTNTVEFLKDKCTANGDIVK